MQKSRVRRVGGLLVALSLVVAACGGDDDGAADEPAVTTEAPDEAAPDEEAPDEEAPDEEAPDEEVDEGVTDEEAPSGADCVGTSDGVLTVGTILPVTGDLAFLGPPEVAGAQIAVEDINAAGGVLGEDVVLHQGDSGDTTTDLANTEVDRLLALGADVIIGAASSAVSFTVIDKITGSCVIQFSPANTSPDFTTYDDNGLYFRTAPSDILQGRVLSNLVLEDGNTTASVVFRQEPYGEGLAESFRNNFEGSGGTIDEFIAYAVNVDSFDAEVDSLVEADSDAIIVIGFDESAAILTTMHERGIGPLDKAVYGVDGNIGGIGAELADPSIIAGMKGTEPSVDLGDIRDFLDRLDEVGDMGGVYAYGAETYDAVIITALATVAAGTDDPVAIAAEINDVTRGPGTECFSFAECRDLLEAGEDIDYIGVGGPYEFVDAGEPSAASFRIATYDGDSTPNSDLDTFVFAS
ncbi:MAG: amino acid ABC transporter substrate-binding protein [Ilumatobacter sp.]|nr:MAG: amino acid ABC transporter substrate-binding protein [Ilumatobacter sp.]